MPTRRIDSSLLTLPWLEISPGPVSSLRVSSALFFALLLVATSGCRSSRTEEPPQNQQPSTPTAGDDGAGGDGVVSGENGGGDAAEDLVESARVEASRRRQEARYLYSVGNRWFSNGDYEKAEELFRKAIELDPTLTDAKRKRFQALMFLGRRDGEIRSLMQDFVDERQIRTEARLAEVRQLLNQGDEYLENDDVAQALRAYGRARENLVLFDYGVDTTELMEEAERKFLETNARRQELVRRLRQEQEESAIGEAEERTRLAEQRRRDRVKTLVSRAAEAMREDRFETVLALTEEVLTLDPQNRTARKLKKDAKELEKAIRYVNYLETDKEELGRVQEELLEVKIPYEAPFQFGGGERWRTKVEPRAERQTDITFEDSFEVARIKRILATTSPTFDFDGETLSEVVAYFNQITDVNIQIDPEVDAEDVTVDLSLSGASLQDALNLIMTNTGLSYTFKYDTLYITTPDKAFGDRRLHVYNVQDVLNKIRDFPGPSIQIRSPDDTDDAGGANPFGFGAAEEEEIEPLTPDDLAEKIRIASGEDKWDESGSTIIPSGGQLIITATQELHEGVQNYLENLRKDSDLFVIVEARFIDIVEDFLEDIGIDSRNLGQPPGTGFGTAYGILNDSSTGGSDPGFMNRGNPTNPSLLQGLDRTAGRVQHIVDGFVGAVQGTRLNAALRGLTLQATWLDPFQINAILRASSEQRLARTLTAPRVTASNGQRVHVSVITQRSYVQDYELVSGGTGLVISEVADPVVATFQDGVILDVRPVISHDRRYVTLDVRPTLAALVNGVISTVTVNLGTLLNAAQQVDIDLPEITLQQAFTSVTVPDGGTVLLGGFRSINERRYESFIPIIGRFPLLKNLFRRKAFLSEKRSLYILMTARVVDLRREERELFE